VNLTGAFL